MKRLIVILLFPVVFVSCYKEVDMTVKKPSRWLGEDSLVMILTEMQLTEGAINHRRIMHLPDNNSRERYYAYVYKKFHITPLELKENMDYYNGNPEKMIDIYDKVLASLLKLQGEIDFKLKQREQRIKDSLAAVDTTIYVRREIAVANDTLPASGPFVWPISKK